MGPTGDKPGVHENMNQKQSQGQQSDDLDTYDCVSVSVSRQHGHWLLLSNRFCFFLMQPDLATHEAKLMQKIQLLCVMEVS